MRLATNMKHAGRAGAPVMTTWDRMFLVASRTGAPANAQLAREAWRRITGPEVSRLFGCSLSCKVTVRKSESNSTDEIRGTQGEDKK
jgi:hypothetical protein